MFSIQTNIASLQAQDYLAQSSTLQTNTIEQVTSGLRITDSGVDAAGLAIANGYRSDEAVLTQGIANANDGQSQLQTLDGGLNNISQLLDRARTLATQSASGTFASGDSGRVTLNAEFQSVLQEINRQAQSIGLDSGGAFAKDLSVFVGGGRAQGSTTATQNGSVSIDLSNSAVDAKSLGLQGVQAEGTGIDLSDGQSTSVQNIITNTTNIASESASGYTNFIISGPGFSDGNKISLAVNLSGVTDTTTLANAINTAIQAAGQGGTQAATAFANAGINATIATDADGKEHLAFNSSTTAFQVEAGDRTSNALLGVTTGGNTPTTTGAALSSTVTGAAATAAGTTTFGSAGAGNITVQLQGGGLASPQNITLAVTSGETVAQALTALTSAVSSNSSLQTAGISLTSSTAGSPLVFSSATGQSLTVSASGDTQNLLGLGSFLTGANGATDYSQIVAGGAYNNATAKGIATYQFSLNGGSGSGTNQISVDLSGGNATSAAVTGSTEGATFDITSGSNDHVSFNIDGRTYNGTLTAGAARTQAQVLTDINGIIGSAGTASFVNNQLVITSATKGAGSSVQIDTPAAHDASATLGLTSGGAAVTGLSRTASDLTAYINSAISASAPLHSAGITATQSGGVITFASTNNSYFRLNTVGSQAVATSSVTGSNFNITTGTNDQLTFAVDGGPSNTITLAAETNASAATVAADINAKIAALPTPPAITVDVNANGSLEFKSTLTGGASSVALTTSNSDDALSALGLTAGTVTGAGPNTGFGAANGNSFAGNTATAGTNTTLDASGANQLANAAGEAQALGFTGIAYGSDTQALTINANDTDGNAQSLTITLGNSATAGPGGTPLRNASTIDQAIATINSELQATNNATLQGIVAVKDDSSGTEQINFLSANSAFQVTVGGTANGTGVTALNQSGVPSQGLNATSAVVGAGGTADISNQSSAEAAVTALANAVTALGNSQAVVGRGENEFTYAANLAQSQLTNETASESQIRDANLAQDSATLTKAQILVQAGVAALAQANSAPQQLLTLLQAH